MATDFVSYWKERVAFLDVHYHVNPDTYTRRFDSIQAGKAYQLLGGGVILKSHLGCTAAVASTAQSQGLPVFGSIVLNGEVGIKPVMRSLSHYGFEHSGRLIVHLPTQVPNKHRSRLTRSYANSFVERFTLSPTSITNGSGALIPEVEQLLEFAQDEPLVISTGHSSRREVEQLVNLADKKGGIRIMLNQPANPITGMDANALKALGNHDWLYVEQTALTLLLGYQTMDDFQQVLLEVNNAIYSSDLGQTSQMMPGEWMEKTKIWFDEAGLKQDRIDDLMLNHPLAMIAP